LYIEFSNGIVLRVPANQWENNDDTNNYEVAFGDSFVLGTGFLSQYAVILDAVKSRVGFVAIPTQNGNVYNQNNMPQAIIDALNTPVSISPPDNNITSNYTENVTREHGSGMVSEPFSHKIGEDS